jgi:hypothetical protein
MIQNAARLARPEGFLGYYEPSSSKILGRNAVRRWFAAPTSVGLMTADLKTSHSAALARCLLSFVLIPNAPFWLLAGC